MPKDKLILDFDDTQVETTKAYCDTYAILYKNHLDFKEPNWRNNDKWDFSTECPLEKNPESIFKNKLFFDNLEFKPYAKEVIERLSNTYEIIICTIGTHLNISLKVLWLEKHLPIVKDIVPIINEGVKMDKSIINMSGATFIDDNQSNLFSSNADRKILFKPNNKTLPWNENWIGETVTNWLELESKLL